jgi:hypothetical protein
VGPHKDVITERGVECTPSLCHSCRQFETSKGAEVRELQCNPPMLLGRCVYENALMGGTTVTSDSDENYVLLYGRIGNTGGLSVTQQSTTGRLRGPGEATHAECESGPERDRVLPLAGISAVCQAADCAVRVGLALGLARSPVA